MRPHGAGNRVTRRRRESPEGGNRPLLFCGGGPAYGLSSFSGNLGLSFLLPCFLLGSFYCTAARQLLSTGGYCKYIILPCSTYEKLKPTDPHGCLSQPYLELAQPISADVVLLYCCCASAIPCLFWLLVLPVFLIVHLFILFERSEF